jgi:hypothetical protein
VGIDLRVASASDSVDPILCHELTNFVVFVEPSIGWFAALKLKDVMQPCPFRSATSAMFRNTNLDRFACLPDVELVALKSQNIDLLTHFPISTYRYR